MEYLLLRETEPPTVEGRTIVARIATYGRVYDPGTGQRERVRPGAFKSPLARPGGVVRYRHQGERPGDIDDPMYVYGAVRALREDGAALLAECELADSDRSEHLLSLVRSGAIHGVSMSATVAESHVTPGGVRDITRVSQLHGVSLTPEPAYDDAAVLALRELATRQASIDAELAWWASLRGSPADPRAGRQPR